MASILDYVSGTRFTCRVRSSLVSNPRVRWFNTWEIRATSDGDITTIDSIIGSIVAFHYEVSYNYVRVDEATMSTWEEDSHPYNPLGFKTVVYNQIGANALGTLLPVALRQTLFCKRLTESGLPGKLFLRGALANEDIFTYDGEWALVDVSAQEEVVQAALLASGLTNHMNGLASDDWAICTIGNDGETRWVTSLAPVQTSDVKLNHKYFDRAP